MAMLNKKTQYVFVSDDRVKIVAKTSKISVINISDENFG
jgi:hypothetical protein